MTSALKILAALMVVLGLTAFGLTATCLAQRNPSPTAVIGAADESPAAFASYEGESSWM